MGDPLFAARFTVPAAPRILVRRGALLDRLADGAQRPLTLVAAPAGAGKTVLAADWAAANRARRPLVWLTVEAGDAPGVFWAHVLQAFRHHRMPLPENIGSPTRADGVDSTFLARLAAAVADAPRPVVLILDQFDSVASRQVADGLEFVLRHAAPKLRLVVTGRSDPPLPLHRYRAAGDITEIRNADLGFSTDDACELLSGHGLALSGAGIEALVERTEGWAAGLRLCALAMQRTADPEAFVREFAADHTTIADFLLTEVLAAQPPATQELLLRASITDSVHPDLVDAITGRGDAEGVLERLDRANAFLARADGSPWYRLHPLFAEVLRAQLRYRHPGLEPRLRQRAARWLASSGRLVDAVEQAGAAGDWAFATAHLVDSLALGRLFTGPDAARLADVCSGVPQDLPGAAPALVRAACLAADHDGAGCAAELRRADEHLGRRETTDAYPGTQKTPGAAAALGRAFLGVLAGRLSGDPEAAESAAALAGHLMRRVPPRLLAAHPELPAMVLSGVGAADLSAGRLEAAESRLKEAVDACGAQGAVQIRCDALGCLAVVEMLRGSLRQAERHARECLMTAGQPAIPADAAPAPSGTMPERLAPAHPAPAYPAPAYLALAHLALAGVAVEHDDLAAAHARLGLATASAQPLPDLLTAVEAAVIASRLAAARSDWAAALDAVRTARPPSDPASSGWTADRLAIAESGVHIARGDAAAAVASLRTGDPDRPEHAVALARALLAAGHDERAAKALARHSFGPGSPTTSRAQVCLLRAQLAAQAGQDGLARRLLRQSLGLARRERLRRLFIEAGPWVRRWLRDEPGLAQTQDWLPSEVRGPVPSGPHGPQAPRTPAVPDTARQPAAPSQPLSGRELEVLRQAAQMQSTDEIAAGLCVSVNTVKTHLKSINRKLGVNRRREAVRRARELGLL